MKPGVKRDAKWLAWFIGGMVGWFLLGFVVAYLTGYLQPPGGNAAENAARAALLNAFMRGWGGIGLFMGIAITMFQFMWPNAAVSQAPERPQDSYLSGKAVALIVSIFLIPVIAFVVYTVWANR